MNIFNENLTYSSTLTIEEKECIANVVLNPKERIWFRVFNYAANILIPLAVCFTTNCNFIAVAIAFILTNSNHFL